MADLLASILLRRPLATSRELLDAVYTEDSEIFGELDGALTAKGSATVAHEIKTTLSMLRRIIEDVSDRQYALRDTIRKSKSGNPIKGAFYAVFMALYDLLIVSELTPVGSGDVMSRLNNIDERLKTERHHTTEQERRTNIDTVRGILAPAFVKRDPPALRSGAGMLYELENSIRRSAIETSRYECKQGLLNLDDSRALNARLLDEVPAYICALANVGPEEDSFLFFGVADKQSDAERIRALDTLEAKHLSGRWVVGVDREARRLALTLEQYVQKIATTIRQSALTEPCKSQVLSQVDVVKYQQLHVIRIRIPAQRQPTYVGEEMFIRDTASLRRANAREAAAMATLFATSPVAVAAPNAAKRK
jgi:hypothetical protein